MTSTTDDKISQTLYSSVYGLSIKNNTSMLLSAKSKVLVQYNYPYIAHVVFNWWPCNWRMSAWRLWPVTCLNK